MQDFGKDLDTVYQSTQVDSQTEWNEDELELASAGKRIGAYLINVLIGMVAYIPLIWGAVTMYGGSYSAMEAGDAAAIEPSGFAMGLVGLGVVLVLAYLIFQAVLMSKTGQSLGKRIMKIKVVNEDGDNPGFVGTVLMREVVPNIGLTIVGLIPFLGGFVQMGFWVACFVLLFMVDRDRRTLQDLIAKTYVVDAV